MADMPLTQPVKNIDEAIMTARRIDTRINAFLFRFKFNYKLPPVFMLWYRVITTFMKRMAARNTPYAHPNSFPETELSDSLQSVLRTGRSIAALRR